MFDGFKILDLSVKDDGNGQPPLLTNDRLKFGSLIDEQTGEFLDQRRKAYDRGLTFQLVPRRAGHGYRVEVNGSLHKFSNNGQHNADQYTVSDLLLTLDQLTKDYGIDLFNSAINSIEFGLNIELPFPVSQVLDNLICYKNRPFAIDSQSQIPYHVCPLQRYAVKLYDKGRQKGLGINLLRFEIRVTKMSFFNGTGIKIHTLADLLNTANYKPLGALLIGVFNDILFDDPTVDTKKLTDKHRDTYLQCCNSRYWRIPDDLSDREATAYRQRLSRSKKSFRELINQYGSNWQKELCTLIQQTWLHLSAVNDNLLTCIDDHRAMWQKLIATNSSLDSRLVRDNEKTAKENKAMFHKLTAFDPSTCHELPNQLNTVVSQINPLYSIVNCDKEKLTPTFIWRVIVKVIAIWLFIRSRAYIATETRKAKAFTMIEVKTVARVETHEKSYLNSIEERQSANLSLPVNFTPSY